MNPETLLSLFHQMSSITDGPARRKAELDFFQICQTDPQNYLQSTLILLNYDKISTDLRLFAIVNLRKMLKDPEFRKCINFNAFLQELLILIKSESNNQIFGFLTEIYGEIVGNLLKTMDLVHEEQAKLNNSILYNDVWELFLQPEEKNIIAGLNILTKLIEVALEELLEVFEDNLFSIVKKMLDSYNSQILQSVINLLTKILSYAEYSLCKRYIPLISTMIEILFRFLSQKNPEGEQILVDFYEIAEAEPKVFIQFFPNLILKTLDLHSDPSISHGIKQQALELIISIIERIPKALALTQPAIEGVFQMIFLHMMSIKDFQIDENFSVENDSEFENVRFGRDAIDRVISSLGGKPVLQILSHYILKLIQMTDWRFPFSALMGLSQVGEYLDEVEEIEGSVEVTLGYFNHPHPMIRYSVCETLGQLSHDMKPEFQVHYHKKMMPLLISILHDNSPMVGGHAAAALNNFIEGMNLNTLKEYLPSLIPELLALIRNSKGLQKEQSILALGNTSKIARDTFKPYLKSSMEVLFEIIKAFQGEKFIKLRGVSIGSICLIGAAIGTEDFKGYTEETLNFMKTGFGLSFEMADLIVAWKRTLGFLNTEVLVGYMNEQDFINIIGMSDYCQDSPEEFENSIKVLNLFLEKIFGYLTPYFDRISNVIIPLTGCENTNNIRILALKGIPYLVKMLISSNKKQQAEQLNKGFLDLIIKMNYEKLDIDVREQSIKTLISILNDKTPLIKQDFESLIDLVWKNIENSMNNKIKYEKKRVEDEDLDEDQHQLLDDDIKAEKELIMKMSDLMTLIFTQYPNHVIDLRVIDNFLFNLVPKALDSGLYKFVIFTIDDMIEEIAYNDILIPHKTTILNLIMQGIVDKTCEIRQASLYGIGVYIEKFKDFDTDSNVIENIRLKIIDALKLKKDRESTRTYGLCKDNAISALGKLFKAHHEKINLKQTIQIWLEGLPIKYDVQEALKQYELLFGVLNSDPNIIIMDSSDNLERVFKIIGEIYGTHLINEGIREMILRFVGNIINLKNYDFDKFGMRFKEMNPSALKRLEQCLQDVNQK